MVNQRPGSTDPGRWRCRFTQRRRMEGGLTTNPIVRTGLGYWSRPRHIAGRVDVLQSLLPPDQMRALEVRGVINVSTGPSRQFRGGLS